MFEQTLLSSISPLNSYYWITFITFVKDKVFNPFSYSIERNNGNMLSKSPVFNII